MSGIFGLAAREMKREPKNLADQNKQTSQYETNLWPTHVINVRLAEPIRRPVRWRAWFSKSPGLSVSVSSFPSPSLLFHLLVLVPFLARPKPNIPFSSCCFRGTQRETT